jgi:hypothetical protein
LKFLSPAESFFTQGGRSFQLLLVQSLLYEAGWHCTIADQLESSSGEILAKTLRPVFPKVLDQTPQIKREPLEADEVELVGFAHSYFLRSLAQPELNTMVEYRVVNYGRMDIKQLCHGIELVCESFPLLSSELSLNQDNKTTARRSQSAIILDCEFLDEESELEKRVTAVVRSADCLGKNCQARLRLYQVKAGEVFVLLTVHRAVAGNHPFHQFILK